VFCKHDKLQNNIIPLNIDAALNNKPSYKKPCLQHRNSFLMTVTFFQAAIIFMQMREEM
jgi:hypothetical protein